MLEANLGDHTAVVAFSQANRNHPMLHGQPPLVVTEATVQADAESTRERGRDRRLTRG